MPSGQNQNDPRGGAPAPPHGSRGRFVTENDNFPQGANDLALVLWGESEQSYSENETLTNSVSLPTLFPKFWVDESEMPPESSNPQSFANTDLKPLPLQSGRYYNFIHRQRETSFNLKIFKKSTLLRERGPLRQ